MPVLESPHVSDGLSEETSHNPSDYASTEHSSSYSFAGRSEADTYYTQAEPISTPQDVNSIQITIADKQTPLVLLVGPPCLREDDDSNPSCSLPQGEGLPA